MPTTLGDIQQPDFVTPAARLGLEKPYFQNMRMIEAQNRNGWQAPDRLTQAMGKDTPAVEPSREAIAQLIAQGMLSPGYAAVANAPAYIASGMGGAPDPGDIDPSTGQPRQHHPSLFKTMAAPTRFLSPESVNPQMPIPFNANGMAFDTKRAMFSPYQVAPSAPMVDIYHDLESRPDPRAAVAGAIADMKQPR